MSQLETDSPRPGDRVEWAGQQYIVMELVEGESFDQASEGVEAAHEIREPGPIAYRDVEPANVMLRVVEAGQRPDVPAPVVAAPAR